MVTENSSLEHKTSYEWFFMGLSHSFGGHATVVFESESSLINFKYICKNGLG